MVSRTTDEKLAAARQFVLDNTVGVAMSDAPCSSPRDWAVHINSWCIDRIASLVDEIEAENEGGLPLYDFRDESLRCFHPPDLSGKDFDRFAVLESAACAAVRAIAEIDGSPQPGILSDQAVWSLMNAASFAADAGHSLSSHTKDHLARSGRRAPRTGETSPEERAMIKARVDELCNTTGSRRQAAKLVRTALQRGEFKGIERPVDLTEEHIRKLG